MRAALSLVQALLATGEGDLSVMPRDAVEIAKQCVLDWFGVTLAARDEELARIVRAEARLPVENRKLRSSARRCAPQPPSPR